MNADTADKKQAAAIAWGEVQQALGMNHRAAHAIALAVERTVQAVLAEQAERATKGDS